MVADAPGLPGHAAYARGLRMQTSVSSTLPSGAAASNAYRAGTDSPAVAANERPAAATRGRARRLRPRASAAHTERRRDPLDTVATALGWFSVALGATELLAPHAFARAVGTGRHPTITRLFGAREIAAGVGLLTQADRAPWLWARVAGDALDLAFLAAAMRGAGASRQARLGASIAAVAGVTALDAYAARRASSGERRSAPGVVRPDGSVHIEQSLAINQPPEACYAMWRDLASLPRFMKKLKSVEVRGDGRSHWVARGPAGQPIEWDAEITRDEPNALLSWRTVEGSELPNAGAVRFIPGPGRRGTIVSVTMQYDPPAGRAGLTLAKLLGDAPERAVREDLRRFKALLETGEIPTIEGQPHGARSFWYTALEGSNR
jgi:uncharacterized membrane protein